MRTLALLEEDGKTMKKAILVACSLVIFLLVPPIMAQEGNPGQNVRDRLDESGTRINDRLDRLGEVINDRLDRRGEVANERLDRRGEVINERLDQRGQDRKSVV